MNTPLQRNAMNTSQPLTFCCVAGLGLAVAIGTALSNAAWAKLPAPSDEAKAKAAETTAKAAHTDKVGSYQLCQSQDRVAAGYRTAAKAAGRDVKVATDVPACADPGVFAYVPAAAASAAVQPPLEAAGAHSPPKTAVAPPSTKTPAAEIAVKK
jgi:hypothetical protein